MFSGPAPRSKDSPQKSRARRITRRLIRLAFLVGLPLALLPVFLPRKVSAKRLGGPDTAAGPASRLSTVARERQLQDLVDNFRARLAIADIVGISIVQENTLVVSVQRRKGGDGGFTMTF